MLTGSNRNRLEQEIANLITFIVDGREKFFEVTGNSFNSLDNLVNHWEIIDLFQKHSELIQLELNIQLFYIKLSSYYDLIGEKNSSVNIKRNVFAHALSNLVFSKKIKYNFILYRVSENFKKIVFLFYKEESFEKMESKNISLDLDKDIKDFLLIWDKNQKKPRSRSFGVAPFAG